MALAARSTWADRALAEVSETDVADVLGLAALAAAPVKPAPYYPPIETAGASLVSVSAEPVFVGELGEEWETHGDLANLHGDYANPGNDRAALRGQLVEAHESGKVMRVTLLLEVGGDVRTVIAEGTLSAIRRAFPDKDALAAWKEAGAEEVPVFDLNDQDGAARRVTWLPIDQAPVVLQMEHESRAKAIAREKVKQFIVRQELAAAVYADQLL